MTAVVVGIGQLAAGDDGVGLHVARVLAARGIEARECSDASLVLALVEAGRRVVIVDAVVAPEPGRVLLLDPADLASGPFPLSSHGIGIADALALARTLYGGGDIAIVGITIASIEGIGLSAAVAAAIEPAAALAAELAGITASACMYPDRS